MHCGHSDDAFLQVNYDEGSEAVSSFVRGITFFLLVVRVIEIKVKSIGYRAQCEQGDEAGAEEGLEVAVIAFAAGQDSTRRLMISPAWNRVSRSRSLSWATAFASHVRFASLALFRTAATLGGELDNHLAAIGRGWGLRSTMPASSSAAMVVPIDCGFMASARAKSAVVAGPSLARRRPIDGGLCPGSS